MADTRLKNEAYQGGWSLLRNGMSNWGPLGANIIIKFLLVPMLIAYLGKGRFGVWVLAGSFVGYYGVLRLGVGAAIMRYVPYYIGQGKIESASEVVSTAMAMFLVVGTLIIVISHYVAEPLSHFYGGGVELAGLIRILGVAAAIECPMRVFDAAVRAHERWLAANVVAILHEAIYAVGLAGCVWAGFGLVEMGYVMVGASVFTLAGMWWLFVRSCPHIKLRGQQASGKKVRQLVGYGIFTTVIIMVSAFRFQAHGLIVGKLMGFEAVAVYSVAAMLVKYAKNLISGPSRVLWPRFAYLDGRGKRKQLARLVMMGTQLNAITAGGLGLGIVLLAPQFIEFWVGQGFEVVYPALKVLVLAIMLENSLAASGIMLMATGHQKAEAGIVLIEGTVGLALSIYLGTVWGLAGVAGGSLISLVVFRGVVCPVYLRLINDKIEVGRFYVQSLFRPWLVAFTVWVFFDVVGIVRMITGWVTLSIAALAVAVVYGVAVFFLGISGELRESILTGIENKVWRRRVVADERVYEKAEEEPIV